MNLFNTKSTTHLILNPSHSKVLHRLFLARSYQRDGKDRSRPNNWPFSKFAPTKIKPQLDFSPLSHHSISLPPCKSPPWRPPVPDNNATADLQTPADASSTPYPFEAALEFFVSTKCVGHDGHIQSPWSSRDHHPSPHEHYTTMYLMTSSSRSPHALQRTLSPALAEQL